MKKDVLIVVLVFLLPVMIWGQMEKDTSFLRTEADLLTQLAVYPQEKIHLHTDRDYYVPGEKIRFKAYLVDALTHQFPTYSRYVYVELITPNDILVGRVMIRPENDQFYGHIPLTEIVPEGNYTLRAYTRYMENSGDDYFFKKNIRIGNLLSDKRQPAKIEPENRRTRTGKNDFEVSFFPEGGNLPEGISCRVAFKALNRNGSPGMISGEVVDETGAEITSVTTFHAGMGMFSYSPEQGKRYYLNCRNGNGVEKQFELPPANSQAYALTAKWNNKKLLIGVQKSIHCPKIPLYLLVHCRGLMLYFSAWDEKKVLRFAEEQLPAGIIHFLLFDEQMSPLSERLAFNKNKDDVKVEFHTDKPSYEPRENIRSTLSLCDSEGNPLTGHLSVAITDDKDLPVDSSTTILSSLLLSSELKGYIENPAYYLQDDVHSITALDYLMMTHGWRRYNIPEVIKGNFEYPPIPYQTSQEISGEVKSLLGNKPVSDSQISIMVKNGYFGTVATDEQGKFLFRDFEYPDSTDYFIQALSKKGNSEVKLDLNRELFPGLVYAPQSPVTEVPAIKKETGGESFLTKAEERSKYDDGMRMVHLSELVVTAPQITKKDEPRLRFPFNEGSDVTIRREDFEKRLPQSLIDVLLRVPGVRIEYHTGKIYIRAGGGAPFVLLDGSPIACINCSPLAQVEQVSVFNVASIDIFKGANAMVFGSRGADGVISITTRTGEGEDYGEKKNFNYAAYTPLGYQKPVEFYAPRYDTVEAKQSSIPDYRTTVFWKPDLVISDTGTASFDFYAADFPTTYSAVLEGLTTDGRIIRQVEKIQVQ